MKYGCLFPLLLLTAPICPGEESSSPATEALTEKERRDLFSPVRKDGPPQHGEAPSGRMFSRKQLAGVDPAKETEWTLKDGRKVKFMVLDYYYGGTIPGEPKGLRLQIQLPDNRTVRYDPSLLDPGEYLRMNKLLWAVHYRLDDATARGRQQQAKLPPEEAMRFYTGPWVSYYSQQEKPATDVETLPPAPPADRLPPSGETTLAWPSMEAWRFADGQTRRMSIYSWSWCHMSFNLPNTGPAAELRSKAGWMLCLRILREGASILEEVNVAALAEEEREHLTRVLWQRYDELVNPPAFVLPNRDKDPGRLFRESPYWLTRAEVWCVRAPFPGLPLKGSDFLPPPPVADRSGIRALDQGDYGSLAGDCLPSSIATVFLWWDEIKWLPLKKTGDIERKAEWLHRQFGREMRTLSNLGTDWGKVVDGLNDFAAKNYGEEYSFQLISDSDYSPANLARYTTGHACTVLSLSVWKGQRHTFAHAVPLVRMDAAGNCEFVTWGHRFTGKWEPVELPGHKKEDPAARILPTYELKVAATNPDTKDFSNYRFILDHKTYDSLHVIVPNKRRAAVPGKQGGK